jgi:2-methylcitrate dehydratase PrpD
MTITRELAAFVVEANAEQVTDSDHEALHCHLLDAVGAMAIGAGTPWARAVLDYGVAESPVARSSVLATRRRLRPEWAALANATAAHGMEIDDYALPALAHPGCVVVPAALAVAEDRRASGAEFLEALAVAFEVVLRLASATTPSLTSHRGFHVTSALGVFGAVAAAGRLLHLDHDQMHHALGLAASHAGGTVEFSRSGGDVKRLHAGMAAAGGIRSAALAGRGLTGPAAPLEGDRGFLFAFVERSLPELVTAGLGTVWHLSQLAIKPYAVCAGLQAPLAAVDDLVAAGLSAGDVARIEVGLDAATAVHVGAVGPAPANLTAAQLSAHHAVAMRLVCGGNFPSHYEGLSAWDATSPVRRLAERVTVVVDEEAERLFPRRLVSGVRVSCADGRVVSARAEAPGSPGRPFGRADVADKFGALLTPLIGAAAVAAATAAVDDVESVSSITSLTAALEPLLAAAGDRSSP